MPRIAVPLLVASLLLMPALALAASGPPAQAPRAYLLRAGAEGVVVQPWSGVGVDRMLCSGTAPLQNTCHIDDISSGAGWAIGWTLPPPLVPGTPVSGPVVYSIDIRLSDHERDVTEFECSIAGAGAGGFWVPPVLGPFCALYSFDVAMQPPIALDIRVGAYDPRTLPFAGASLPSLNSVPLGVGPWEFDAAD